MDYAIQNETREWIGRIPLDLNRAGVDSSVERVTAIGFDMEQAARFLGRETRDLEAQRLAQDILNSVKSFRERIIPLYQYVMFLKAESARVQSENVRFSRELAQVQHLRHEYARLAETVKAGEEIAVSLTKAVDEAKGETEVARQEKCNLEEEVEKLKGQNVTTDRRMKSKEAALDQVKAEFGKRIRSREEELETVKRQRELLKEKEIKHKSQIAKMSAEIDQLRAHLKAAESRAYSSGPSISKSVTPSLVYLDSDDEFDGAPLPTPPMSSDPGWPSESETQRTKPSVVPQKRKTADALGLPIALDRNGKPKGCVQLGSRRKW